MFDCETQAPGDGGSTQIPTASPVSTTAPTNESPLEKTTPYPTATPTKYPTATPTITPTANPTITPTTATPTIAPTLSTPKYLGCWNEAPTRAMDHSAGSGWNIPACIEYCRGKEFPFAGLQFFSQCVCSGNSYSKHGKALESDCNTECTKGEGICGGVWRIGVWTTGLPIPPSPSPTPVPTPLPTPIPTTATPTTTPTANPTIVPTTATPTAAPTLGTPKYLGCWNEAPTRAMNHSAGSGWNISACIEYCRGEEFPFAGLQFFSQCACSGNSYSKHGKALESDCNTECTKGEGICGGVWRIGVWTTGLPIPPSPSPTPVPTPLPTPVPTTSFNIALGLKGINDDRVFQNAVDTWGKAITGDLPDFAATLGGSSSCGGWPSYVDDLYICGRYASIDGISGVLGSAGPRHYRPSIGIPITGEMKFDSADVARLGDDKMLSIILHEMGHVLGIGPMWQINGLIDNFNVPCPYKTDSEASRVYQELSGCAGDAVPVEMSFPGGGSNCGHWQESCLGTEIMTPMASGTLPLSKITIAGLKDLGYTVNYDVAEEFNEFGCSCGSKRLRRRLQNNTTNGYDSGRDVHPPQQRRLSEEGMQRATEYGKLVLAENRQAMSLVGSGDAPDIGGEIIYILYEEDGVIHSVMVRE